MKANRHFKPAVFAFLRDLTENNDRDWFLANIDRYETAVREPALQFIRDFSPRLDVISHHFRADARKSGGSLFRIHRDVRFSPDKSPYKTYVGIHFRHEAGKNAHCPGFYLHLEPRSVFAGAGIWHPDGDTLRKIRAAIVDDPDAWRAARDDRAFRSEFELAGDALVRAPRGVDPDHPLIDDLKRKDFIGITKLSQRRVTSAGFIDVYAELCAAATPMVGFLCRALDVPF